MSSAQDVSNDTLHGILEELKSREPLFHHPELGTSESDYERMTEEDFWEVGASGRIYNRSYVIKNLVERYSKPFIDEWVLKDCLCRELSSDVYLFTYTLWQGDRQSRRATLWRRSASDWKIVYHQGTLVQPDP